MPDSINRTVRALQSRYLAPAMRRLNGAWQWWIGQLDTALPENARQFVRSARQHLIISANNSELLVQHGSTGNLQVIGRIRCAGNATPEFPLPDNVGPCVLVLPQDQVLTTAMTLPMAAEENLREVLSFEMDRQTPFRADDVYYDFAITERSTTGKTLSVQLFVAPRHVVDKPMETLAAAGIRPAVVTAHAENNPDGLGINLLPVNQRSKRGAFLQQLNAALAIVALLLLTTLITLPLLHKERVIEELQEKVNAAATIAQTANELRREVEILVEGSSYLINKKQTELTMMRLLNEITDIIPDDTWINRIDVNNGEVQLQGQSGSAAALIALIEASPMFHNVRFRSPVTRIAQTEQERFHLSAEAIPGSIE